jgi:hypothetical protein
MDPVVFAELRRIGNNINQIAHATNSNLPTDVMYSWKSMNQLLSTLLTDEILSQKIAALRTRPTSNDPPPPQTRDVFQRSVQLHPARRGQENP